MTRRSVLLPQPFGPMSATISPPGDREVDPVERDERLGIAVAVGDRHGDAGQRAGRRSRAALEGSARSPDRSAR